MKKMMLAVLAGVLVLAVAAQGAEMELRGAAGVARRWVSVEVDYSRSQQQLATGGDYLHVDPQIPLSGKFGAFEARKLDIVILNFGQRMFTEQVVAGMKRTGLRPATLTELLALGNAQSEVLTQTKLVVALGTAFDVWTAFDGSPVSRVAGIERSAAAGKPSLVSRVSKEMEWADDVSFVAVDASVASGPEELRIGGGTGGYHFAAHLLTGPGITVGGKHSELVVPFFGIELWAAKRRDGKFLFGGIAPTTAAVYSRENRMRAAVGLQLSPVAFRVYSDQYGDVNVYLKPAYTMLWTMESGAPKVPRHSFGIQLIAVK